MIVKLAEYKTQLLQAGYGYNGTLDAIRQSEYDNALKGVY
jgi:hypothetical protein